MKSLFILPEYWSRDFIGACGWIRLLDPLLGGEISNGYRVEYGYSAPVDAGKADIVIFERLWHPMEVNIPLLFSTLRQMKNNGTRIIYSIDDNLPDYTIYQKSSWYSPLHLTVIHAFLHYADVVVVSAPALKERLSAYNPHIEVIPNAIDPGQIRKAPEGSREKVRFGYLASPDNTGYLYSILEPLRRVLSKYRNNVTFEIIGHLQSGHTAKLFQGLPAEFTVPPETAYQKYIPWLMEHCDWDFGIAPITRNDFTRCKSDMKFLDFTRLGIPGIYTDFTPYEQVREHEAGLMVDGSWEEAISAMIEDSSKRDAILRRAADYVGRERNLEIQRGQWRTLLDTR